MPLKRTVSGRPCVIIRPLWPAKREFCSRCSTAILAVTRHGRDARATSRDSKGSPWLVSTTPTKPTATPSCFRAPKGSRKNRRAKIPIMTGEQPKMIAAVVAVVRARPKKVRPFRMFCPNRPSASTGHKIEAGKRSLRPVLRVALQSTCEKAAKKFCPARSSIGETDRKANLATANPAPQKKATSVSVPSRLILYDNHPLYPLLGKEGSQATNSPPL